MTIWTTLGIAPTRDRTAVRRAYAERLKQTHPEDDPEGFQALRQAYEIALAQIARAAAAEAQSAPPPPEPAPTSATVDEARIVEDPSPAEPPAPAVDPFALHWAACQALERLVGEGADEAALRAALAVVLASPVMENLTVRSNTEIGLARMILARAPRADSLIAPAADYFGWDRGPDRWDRAPEIGQVLARGQIAPILAKLRSKSSRYHKAAALLSRPPPEGAGAALSNILNDAEMRAFFAFARRQPPALMAEFNSAAVAFWSKRLGAAKPARAPKPIKRVRVALGVIFVIYFLVRMLTTTSVTSNPSPSVTGQDLASQTAVQTCLSSVNLPDGPRACDEALRLAPTSAAARGARARIRLEKREFAGAVDDYLTVLETQRSDPDALFGIGIALTELGNENGNAEKLQAVRLDPGVAARFPGFPAQDLVVFETPPQIIRQPAPSQFGHLMPQVRLAGPLYIEAVCYVGHAGDLHDCTLRSPLNAATAPFGAAMLKILPLVEAKPALLKGAVVDDAPIRLGMTFGPAPQPKGSSAPAA